MTDVSLPARLICVDAGSRLDAVVAPVRSARWTIERIAPEEAALIDDDSGPCVFLVGDCEEPGLDGVLAAIRGGGSITRYAPVLAVGQAAQPVPLPLAPDGWVDVTGSSPSLADVLGGWAATPNPALARLTGVFGAEPISSLLARFRDMLANALATPPDLYDAGIAHRIMGLGGTLGYPDLSAAWATSDDGNPDIESICRHTRIAVYAMSRDLSVMSVA